jgi:sulfate transport system substrate-binding protein
MTLPRRSVLQGSLAVGAAALLGTAASCGPKQAAAPVKLLNVSYDPTRELYKAINEKFIANWKAKSGQTLEIDQSHGGSGSQSRKVVDGLQADVVTLALAADINAIAPSQGLPQDWQARLPNNSSPYTSTIVFVVRKGNPKGIKDWGDLIKPGVSIVTPNPKVSGGARWNYIAAWGWALHQPGGTAATAQDFVSKLYKQAPVLDSGARAATLTFAQRAIGDALLTWENEAHLTLAEFPNDAFEIVAPTYSVLAEPPVAWLDKNTAAHGTAELAKAYLEYLYTPEAQDIIGANFYRPRSAEAAAKYAANFPKIELVTIDDPAFGGWTKAQAAHFADGGIFDKIYIPSVK